MVGGISPLPLYAFMAYRGKLYNFFCPDMKSKWGREEIYVALEMIRKG